MNKDISIIGASSAGLFTAILLARQRLPVRVFEAKKDINHSPRTLIVTSSMQDLMGSLCKEAVINRIHRFEMFTDGRVATVSLKRPDMVIERSRLIQRLSEKAKANGATVLTDHRFVNCTPNGATIHFTVSGNGKRTQVENKTNVLVGADGAFSRVAQSAGWPQPSTVSLVQAIVALPKDMPSDTVRIWFIPEETPYFYWLIPHSPTHGVLGLIGEQDHDIQGRLEHFLKKKDVEPLAFQNAQVAQYTRWIPNHCRVGKGDVYLVGDAAGHVKVTTVGGIVTGFRGAFGVTEAILNGGSSKEFSLLQRELNLHKFLRSILHRFQQKDYAMLLDLLSPSVKHSLSHFTRDETMRLLFRVLFKQPRFFLLGLRALLSR